MFRLADETTLERVEGALLRAREFRTQVSSWWWNAFGVLFVVVSFLGFLYARRAAPVQEEKQHIPFTPQVWYSATKNVRGEDMEGQRQPLEYSGPGNWEAEAGAPV